MGMNVVQASSRKQLLPAMTRDGNTAAAPVPHSVAATDGPRRAPTVKQDATEPVDPNTQGKLQCKFRNALWGDQVEGLMHLAKLTPQVSTCQFSPQSTLAQSIRLDGPPYAPPPTVLRDLAGTDGMLRATALPPPGSHLQQPTETQVRERGAMRARASDSAVTDVSRAVPSPKRPAARPVGLKPQSKKQRRNYGGYALSADQVEALMDQDHKARPSILDSVGMAQAECGGWIFAEKGKSTRLPDPRADKWRRGGGAGGATDLPYSQTPRVRRRYGYVIPVGAGPRLRYHQYCRLISGKEDGEQSDKCNKVVEDTQIWLYHVLPQNEPTPPVRSPEAPSVTPTSQGTTEPGPALGSLGIAKELLAAFDGDFAKAVECLLTAHKFA